MEEYDPLIAPDPATWLSLSETDRDLLVTDYHTLHPPRGHSLAMHAAVHVLVENQVAEGDATPVAAKLRQLMAQGLDRHDALHAIGSVLIQHIHRISRGQVTAPDHNKLYYSKLRRLSARDWLRHR